MQAQKESGALGVLEWSWFIKLAQKEVRSEAGQKFLERLEMPTAWASDVSAARCMQQETQEMIPVLDREALWGPLAELPDLSDLCARLVKGAVLELADLTVLRQWLFAIDSWVQIPREEIRGERFKKALLGLSDPLDLLRILNGVLTPNGELSEKASPKLAALTSEIRSLKREIGVVLDQLVKTYSSKGILQENFTDVRDGRYVIPLKIASQNEVDGIIYEASASRQTVFVEPKEVAGLNNRLRQRQNELIQEIYRILEETSKKLQPYTAEVERDFQTLSYWDAIQAKARLGRHYSGKAIQVSEERRFLLKQTAHPLLWWSMPAEEIIRNDVDFSSPARALLLTGPNTGGKTVFLKTLGLAGICARTGFLFPATDLPEVPFFDSFFADLGDPQSIEQHLSSFSGHVLRFKQILEGMTDRSLILIDELNSATDPEEGAAFGRAVLETLMSRDALIVTTTHDPHLKALALKDVRILNASMAFDETSRLPTYTMVLGVPGRSRALETAARLGIPSAVIELAKSYLSHEHKEFENLLAKLESDVQEVTTARKDAVALRMEAERLKKEWESRTEASVQDMMERTRQKLRRILEQAQDEVRASLRKLDELRSRKEIDQTRSGLNQVFSEAASRLEGALEEESPEIAKLLPKLKKTSKEGASSSQGPAAQKLEAGMTVRVPKWKSVGTVLEVTGNRVKIAMGQVQMTLTHSEVDPIPGENQKKQSRVHTHISGAGSQGASSEVDLRGMRLEEAMSHLEKCLDFAFRSGSFKEVTIIHGLGTGALREGAHQLLKKLPYVAGFRDGGVGHGGSGATVVELDRD